MNTKQNKIDKNQSYRLPIQNYYGELTICKRDDRYYMGIGSHDCKLHLREVPKECFTSLFERFNPESMVITENPEFIDVEYDITDDNEVVIEKGFITLELD